MFNLIEDKIENIVRELENAKKYKMKYKNWKVLLLK